MTKKADGIKQERAMKLASELLNKWGLENTEANINQWALSIQKLGKIYLNYLNDFDNDTIRNENSPRLPSKSKRISLLSEIHKTTENMVILLEKAITIHPDFIQMHLIPANFSKNNPIEEIIFSDFISHHKDNFNDISLIKILNIISMKAQFEVMALDSSESTPRWNSYVYGHPTMRLIRSSLIYVSLLKLKDPLKMVDQLVFIIHKYIGNEKAKDYEDGPPGWLDYVSQVRAWWRTEGQEIWDPILTLPSEQETSDKTEQSFREYSDRLKAFEADLIRRDVENDLGRFGGASPDPRKMRKAKKGAPRTKDSSKSKDSL